MSEATSKPKRPYSLTLVSYVQFIWVLFTINYFYRLGFQGLNTLDIIYKILFGIVSLVCGVGFWMTKKWAVYLFAAFAFITQIYSLLTGSWSSWLLLVSAVIFYVGFRNLSKMS
jgi:hypothetical protein